MFSLQLELYVFLYGYFSLQQRHFEKVGFKVILNKVELLGSSSSLTFFMGMPECVTPYTVRGGGLTSSPAKEKRRKCDGN